MIDKHLLHIAKFLKRNRLLKCVILKHFYLSCLCIRGYRVESHLLINIYTCISSDMYKSSVSPK